METNEQEEELTPIQKAHLKRKEMREAGIVLKKKNPIEKAREKPLSLRLAINAKCYDCAGESKKEITICHITDCPLWHVRPYQDDTISAETLKMEESSEDEIEIDPDADYTPAEVTDEEDDQEDWGYSDDEIPEDADIADDED